ncbi:uncharacterized protein LOC123525241 [Mercenaria mercenaria]|uniref:uncharacterized protein LOC123525241 n=1 Tax=Mercenaria mercenaria TaxID=6596 RepID=UPI00234EA663|nr:uncharacterized protein LOC123525241 [Mercenaria mercenaria]
MFGLCFLTVLLFYLDINTIVADEFEKPEVFPRSQKVVENSPVVFTCVSNNPEAEIFWYKGNRPVDEEADQVSIRRMTATSVLRINEAHIKKHKKTYSCHVKHGHGQSTVVTSDVTLKVLSRKRLHKNFPHIAPVRTGDDYILPSPDPGSLHMKCESLATKKSKPSWRWIKDDFIDLSLDNHDDSEDDEDRIEVTDEGDLIISKATVRDSGRYMCVATNNRGSAYGMPVKVTVQEGPPVPVSDGCFDDMGVRSAFGETYNREGDPCTTCTCIEGAGLSCKSVSCFPMPCPPGQRHEMSSEKCCEHKCVPISEESTDVAMCTDRDGRQVASGERFMPEEDPCLQCECHNGRRGRCMMVACQTPTCNNYTSSRDVCCSYTCLSTPPPVPSRIEVSCKDHLGRAVSDGDMYQPEADPCVTCECVKGLQGICTTVVCDEPACKNYRLIPGTCCGFECLDEETESVEIDLDGGCRAHDGSYAGNGDSYHPRADPCVTCMCERGHPVLCRSIACFPPPMRCSDPIPVPGVCCQFTCEPPEPALPILDNVEKVLGRIFIQQIGSNKAFVQWKIPEKFSEMPSNLTVFCFKNASDMGNADVIRIGDRPYAILRDLDPNFEYHIMVNGTLGKGRALMSSRPVRFSLDGRGRSSFVLSDAIGQVFESRGSIPYEGYSLPRKFDPVVRTDDVKVILNTESFHRVEVSTYNEAPCMDQDCGLLRFYLYTMEGESKNVLSLMFTNKQDFSWAKAHL